jgi:2-polyprenyl-6-hydroxyphenyl methylase/3-demethylubiquinone-9 3-methyltransferase
MTVATRRCKCCDAEAIPFAALDFSRTCEDRHAAPFPPSGEMVSYFRCQGCGFIFTDHFDAWSPDAMAQKIYNADYRYADPEFAETRPTSTAADLVRWLGGVRSDIAALDYGGGEGKLARLMRDNGFDYDSYDPFFADNALPARRYDLVTSFEVVEHSADPYGNLATLLSFTKPNGAVLVSTALQPPDVTGDWWYIAPRNGHISIHSARSLQHLARRLGVHVLTIDSTHLLYRRARDPVARALLKRDVFGLLWHASKQNARSLAKASLAAAQLGRPLAALDPRHPARLLLGERRRSRPGPR